MRIALVILHANPARGGAERYTIDLAHGLRGRGHDVTLLASSFPDAPVIEGCVLLRSRGATRAGRYASFLEALNEHLSATRYDIVHAMLPVRTCDVYHPHAGIAAANVTSDDMRSGGAVNRLVLPVARRFQRRRRMFAEVEQSLLSGPPAPLVLCLSEYVKGFVRKHYQIPPDRLATLFNAVDVAKFDPADRPEAGAQVRQTFRISPDDVVALLIAQDFERKGLREAILATAAIKDPRLMLLVVGKQDPEPYRQLAQRRGVADRIVFAGPTSDPYAFYRAADFFVLPTRHDPCSLVVLEALAMGLPVISTVFNGACEIMDERHGYVLREPTDIGALASAMHQMLDPTARASKSQACLQLRPKLAYANHLDQMMQIYERAVRE